MAKQIVNECVSCGLPCLGSACPNRNIARFTCDDCEEYFDTDELYMYDGEMFCSDCLLKKFETAEQAGYDYSKEIDDEYS